MLKFLLDTGTVSAAVARHPNSRIAKRLAHNGDASAIASPVWHELLFGVERMPPSARRNMLDEYMRSIVRGAFPILAYDERAAEWHARERVRLEKLGKTPPFADGQIAAIAATNDLTLVTTNTKHFALFKGVELADWAR